MTAPLLLITAAAAGAARISVEIEGERPADPLEVELALEPQAAGGTGEATTLRLSAPGAAEVTPGPGATVWRVEARAEGYWAAERLLSAGQEALRLTLYPTGELTGRLLPPRGSPPPPALEARFLPPPSPTGSVGGPQGTVSCPVGPDQRFACALPAGVLDLRLEAIPYAPVYRWQVTVAPRRTWELGGLRLHSGGSVVGWVISEEDGRPVARAKVGLSLDTGGALPDLDVGRRLDALAYDATTDERGFFQILGAAPGRYVLTAVREGFAPAHLFPVVVRPGLESELQDPLALGRPVDLEVRFQPPVDPYGRPWHLELLATDRVLGKPVGTVQGQVPAEGLWRRRGLAPGSYRLVATDEEGTRWVNQEIELRGERVELGVEVPLVAVVGSLTLGDEPATGLLWLGGEHGPRRVRFDADLGGRFEGYLPEEGKWPVDVELHGEETLRIALDPVEVSRPPGSACTELAIRIPDTLLEGEVVDEEDRPVPRAEVRASRTSGEHRQSVAVADGAGEFRFRGLPEGQHAVGAESEGRTSASLPVLLDEDLDPPRLRLVIRSTTVLVGRVSAAGAPVPGARVAAWPDLGDSLSTGVDLQITGPDGTFRFEVPAVSPGATLVVAAPGYAVRLLRASLGSGEPLEVPVDPAGGILVVTAEAPGPDPGRRPAPLLVHQGAFVLLPMLTRLLGPSHLGGDPQAGRLEIHGLEPGDWSLCRGAAAVRAMKTGAEAPAEAACSGGLLLAHGELVLQGP